LSARDVNLEINLQGNAHEILQDLNESFSSFLNLFEVLISQGQKIETSFGLVNNQVQKLDKSLVEASGSSGHLFDLTQELSKEMNTFAGEALKGPNGLMPKWTRAFFQPFKNAVGQVTKQGSSLGKYFDILASVFAVNRVLAFGQASLQAFAELEKQQVMVQNLAGRNYPQLQSAIQKAIEASKGLSSEGALLEASNQALKMGASFEFVSQTLSGFQKASAVTGANMTEMMSSAQDAILTGRISFFKENGAIFGQYMDQMEVINKMEISDADKRLKRESLITEALSQNSELQKQYGSYMQTTSAMMETYNQRWGDLLENVGTLISKGFRPLLGFATGILNFFTDSENGLVRTSFAMQALAATIATIVIPILYAWFAANLKLIGSMIILGSYGLLIFAAFALVLAIFDSISTWMEGGDSLVGDFLGPFATLPDRFMEIFNKAVELAKEYGIYLLYALFPVLLIPKLWSMGFDLLKKGWQKGLEWMKGNSFFGPILKDISALKQKIETALSGFDLSGMFDGLIPFDTINWFIEKLNDIMVKLSRLSKESRLIPDFDWSPIKPLVPRKEGGPLQPGGTYLVAEPGTGGEILQMGGSGGMATPVNKLKPGSSGVSISFGNIIVNGNNASDLAQDFVRQVESALETLAPKMRMATGLSQGV